MRVTWSSPTVPVRREERSGINHVHVGAPVFGSVPSELRSLQKRWILRGLWAGLAASLLAVGGQGIKTRFDDLMTLTQPEKLEKLRPSTMKTTSDMVLTNQFIGPIDTVLAGIEPNDGDGPDGLNPLQRNFFRALRQKNPEAKIVLVFNNRLTDEALERLQQTLHTEIGFPQTHVTLMEVSGSVTDYQQDNLLALVNPKTGAKIALEPKGGYNESRNVASELALQKLGFTERAEADVYFEGGDLRPLMGPNGPSLVIGHRSLWQHTMRNNHAPIEMSIRVVQSTSEFIKAFGKYGYDPPNIFFYGSNHDNITFGDIINRMKPADRDRLHPHVLAMKDQAVPLEGMDYHTDLIKVRTDRKDKNGKPFVLMSEPVPPPPPYDSEEHRYIGDFHDSRRHFLKEKKLVESWGFAVRTLPYAKCFPEPRKDNPSGTTLINYANVVMEETPNGKTRIYLGVRGGEDEYDKKAIAAYREVYGDSAEIIPVVGMRDQRHVEGLLNCLFNVISRKE
jgi:hypothetical protein